MPANVEDEEYNGEKSPMRLQVEVCVLGYTGDVPFRPVFIEKTQKNEVFRHGLRMGRVASCRHILMNFHIRRSSRLKLILVATTLLELF